MRLITVSFMLTLTLLSCQTEEAPVNINSPGQVKIDDIGDINEGWGIGSLVVSHDGFKIYYAVVNFQTSHHELRMIDANSKVTKIFSGVGEIASLDISEDDAKLLYSIAVGNGAESKLYEYGLDSEIAALLLTVSGDGYFWDAQYLPDGDVVYTQGNGQVGVSLRRLERRSKEVSILLDKSENPLLRDIDRVGERILLQGWSSGKIITLKFDGTGLRYIGEHVTQIAPVCFSFDGSEILAYQQGNLHAPSGSPESFTQAISFDVETEQKSVLTQAKERIRPLAYGKDNNELLVQVGNEFPMELAMFDRSLNTYRQLTSNELSEFFRGFYGNSYGRILFEAADESGNNGLYILNK